MNYFVEERLNAPSDLDSLSAQQVDEKFKEIMRKKRGAQFFFHFNNTLYYIKYQPSKPSSAMPMFEYFLSSKMNIQ